MAIEKQSYLYEVLVRGARDGSIVGAHQIHNEVLIDVESGEVLNERQGLARDLATEDVASLLGEAFTAAAAQIEELRGEAASMASERDQATMERDAARRSAESAQTEIAALQGQIAHMTRQREAAIATAPAIVSDRQFAQGLALLGLITREEALAFVQTGALPDLLAAYVASIEDEPRRFEVKMLLSGAKEFHRDHPLVPAIAAWAGLDGEALDAFWSQCAAL